MPEIDTDLFQILALALLFLCLLSLLATLSALSGIKKLLEARPRDDGLGVAPASSTYDYQAPAAATYEPAAAHTPALAAQTQQQEVSTGFVPMSGGVPATSQASGTALTGGLRGDEPEEQPFERDGRWWFKRGSELLVYDEGTGQWVASPQGGAGFAPAAGTQTLTPAVQADAGEGWKCSSCGAVNGSTATSCRMCFAPR